MKTTLILIALASTLGYTACGDSKKEATNEKTANSPATERKADQNHEKILEDYIQLKDALVATDAAQAKEKAKNLSSGLQALSGSETAQEHVSKINSSDDIKIQREHFSDLSDAMTEMIKKGNFSNEKIYLQHCPMALNGKGANWLSKNEEIKNPYFGDQMLECGEVKEVIK